MVDFENIKKEYDKLLQQLSDPELISDWERFKRLSERKNLLEKIIEKGNEIVEIKNKIEENKAIISAKEDSELVSLANEELISLKEKEKILENELAALDNSSKASLSPRSTQGEAREKEPSAVIVEIRAGTGGEEASLFAGDLFRMYSKYGVSLGWQQKTLDSHPSELRGFKEIIFELKSAGAGGGDVFSKMKYEAGVHRVQRIPETEKGGRIHTSTASVAVLPKPKKAEIKINPADLKTDVYKSSGPGGQYVNKRETAVRITHLPTGLVVTSQTERNLLQNKENAMAILSARLLEKKEVEESMKIERERKIQIGKAKRAEKIRTYNFPQDRVTDHRIKKSWHNIEDIMAGRLEPIIKALRAL